MAALRRFRCAATLRGHTNVVYCVAALPNGNVVSVSCDRTLKVWDALTGACIQTLTGHACPARGRCPVYCVAALSNGRVVSGSSDNTLKVWDASSGQCLCTLSGHKYSVYCVAVLSNGRVVSGSRDETLKVWDVSSGQCLRTLTGHTNDVYCVAALPNGRVVSGSRDETLKVWNVSSGQCLRTLCGHMSSVNCLAVLSNGSVVSGSCDNTLKVWDPSTSECLCTLCGHMSYVKCVAVMSNGNVVSGSGPSAPITGAYVRGAGDHTLKVWDVSSGRCLWTLRGHTDDARRWRPVKPHVDCSSTPRRAQVNCVVALPCGRLVSGSKDRTLKVWEDVEWKMARLVARRRLHEMNVETAGRLIAAFL